MGVERIFASPGSDWAPLWEALAKPYQPGEVPEYISSRHEETAVGMASGYAKATGKLPALVLHTTVGALHATMGLRAALHERIPMVVMAGESVDFSENEEVKAGRQWLRVLTDLGGPARLAAPSVKWSFTLGAARRAGPPRSVRTRSHCRPALTSSFSEKSTDSPAITTIGIRSCSAARRPIVACSAPTVVCRTSAG